jgi:hypothetical protein
MQAQVLLTPSQSKRLIAKGIIVWEPVKSVLKNGILVIGKGTTNAYVAEELKAKDFDPMRYCHGRNAPAGVDTSWLKGDGQDVVFEKGVELSGKTAVETVAKMASGDVFLKGANALNYDLGQVAVQIAHPTGGTMGGALGGLVTRRVRLVHPVGLEKNIPGDLLVAARRMAEEGPSIGDAYGLWVSQGEIFTEIEALETLLDVEAVPIAAGGVAGGEGQVTIALFGAKGEIEKAVQFVRDIQKEPAFGARRG